jgi:hypothetical protein
MTTYLLLRLLAVSSQPLKDLKNTPMLYLGFLGLVHCHGRVAIEEKDIKPSFKKSGEFDMGTKEHCAFKLGRSHEFRPGLAC